MLRDKKVVLVVDDWEVDRIRVVERMRSEFDARYIVAPDGLEAIEAIERDKPDLVVTDLVMPRMDGLQLVEYIRKRYSFLPAVLITSQGSEDVALRALKAGAVSYVPKQELGRLVDTVINVLELSIGYQQQERLRGYWKHTQSEFNLDNDETTIPILVSHLLQQASNMRSLDDTESFRLGVALSEALANAVQHGNLELSSTLRQLCGTDSPDDGPDYYELVERRRCEEPYCQRRVHVTVRESPAEGRYTIRDQGPGFDRRLLERDCRTAENVARPSGRGLFLIHTFMAEVAFNETGNEITLTHRFRLDSTGGNGSSSGGNCSENDNLKGPAMGPHWEDARSVARTAV